MFFDFVDGAAGDEKLCELNSTALDQIRLEPKVLRNVERRNLSKEFFKIKSQQRIILMTTKATKSYSSFKFQIDDTILFGRESAGVPQKIHNLSLIHI